MICLTRNRRATRLSRDAIATLLIFLVPASVSAEIQTTQWTPVEIALDAVRDYAWWEFPVEAVFTHADGADELTIPAYASGPGRFTIRFAPPLAGRWTFRTRSADPNLNGHAGTIVVAASKPAEVKANPNLRGHIRIHSSGRCFEYADGTPVFLLGDTNWSINTSRCRLGENGDGPFFTYLADRAPLGFNTILLAYMRGFGDTNEPAGQRNEGGYPFLDGKTDKLNFDYFTALDRRMDAIWRAGFIVAAHPTWFGKRNCFFSLTEARRVLEYTAVRYGAYNALWSLSGEYQYAMKDCGWSAEDISQMGRAVQARNPYHHPLSIHPSGRTDWAAPHGSQSSRAFHASGWLDHHWLQTGQAVNKMHYIVSRLAENRRLEPPRPVFVAEAYYERSTDPDRAYHSRWQAWSALLNGAAGYGHGAFGIWQFYTPDEPNGETGKKVAGAVPWPQALAFEGSRQFKPLKKLLDSIDWWKLSASRDSIMRDGRPVPLPAADDLTPPSCAFTPDGLCVIYIPCGNADAELSLSGLKAGHQSAYWFNPRTGDRHPLRPDRPADSAWPLPGRPKPAGEDWVAIIGTKDGD